MFCVEDVLTEIILRATAVMRSEHFFDNKIASHRLFLGGYPKQVQDFPH